MALGPRSKRFLVAHNDPQRAQRSEEQRRRALMVLKQRGAERENTAALQLAENARIAVEEERARAEALRREKIRYIKSFHLEDLDSLIDHYRGDPVLTLDHLSALGLVPETVLEMAQDPDQVRALTLESGRYDADFLVLERSCRDQHRWDDEDLRIFRSANPRAVQFALDRGRLYPEDKPMQRYKLSKMYPANSRTPMLVMQQYADRGFSPEIRMQVLSEICRLSEMGFQDRMVIKPFEFKTALHASHANLVTNLSTMSWRERRRLGLPEEVEYDRDYVVSMRSLKQQQISY